MLDRLALKPASRRTPGPGEVEVQVEAAGVNFRDVMKALGIYPMQPGDVPWLGDEFAGRVLAAGEGVDLEVGQAVFGVAPAAFGSAVSTRADYVLPMPEGLSPEEAATLPDRIHDRAPRPPGPRAPPAGRTRADPRRRRRRRPGRDPDRTFDRRRDLCDSQREQARRGPLARRRARLRHRARWSSSISSGRTPAAAASTWC